MARGAALASTAKTAAPARPRRAARPKGPPCANCQTALVGAYCHACGQKAHLHDKLRHLVEEFAEGIAHFDGRLWRTLPLLALDPGRLSREWMAGRRVRYVAPLHVFLFAVFLLFLIPNFTGRHLIDLNPGAGRASGFMVATPEGERRIIAASDGRALREDLNVPGPVIAVIQRIARLQENPEYYGYKLEALAYKLSFMTVPISIAILWLMFAWRRRFSLYHHAVVSLYGLGFLALMVAVASIPPEPLSGVLNLAVFLVAPAHAAAHLRGAYGRGWVQTLLRTLALGVLTIAGFTVFLLGVVFLGLTG